MSSNDREWLLDNQVPELVDDLTRSLLVSRPKDIAQHVQTWAVSKTQAAGGCGGLAPKQTIDDIFPVTGKRVFIRVDFNVPIKGGVITNDFRIRESLPTMKKVLDNGGKVILASHLGRPKGVFLKDVAKEAKATFANIWKAEKNSGKTKFFASLLQEDRVKVLQLAGVNVAGYKGKQNEGKVAAFAGLAETAKKDALLKFVEEDRKTAYLPIAKAYSKATKTIPGYEAEGTLKPVAQRLSELLGKPVAFAEDCLQADEQVAALKNGDVLLLENLRFYEEEGAKKEEDRNLMAAKLSEYTDVYVCDAFGTAHRDAASITGVPKLMGHGTAGYLMNKEITYFGKALTSPARPVVAIVGGSKVSSKILILENLLNTVNTILIGGAMAYTFLKSQGVSVGSSFCETEAEDPKKGKVDILALAAKLLKTAQEKNVKIMLPVDHVVHTECKETKTPQTTPDSTVPVGLMALDVGPKTILAYSNEIKAARTIIWNGPVGVFEVATFAVGTFAIAKAIAENRECLSIVGGGDSVSAVEKCNLQDRMSHVSTGGGASLELLEGKILPGIKSLTAKK